MSKLLRLLDRAKEHGDATALLSDDGASSFRRLADAALRVASALLDGRDDLREARVAMLAPPGLDYVAAMWGIQQAGGIAVPLCSQHPPPEMAYVLDDCTPSAVLVHPDYRSVVQPLADERALPCVSTTDAMRAPLAPLPTIDPSRRALILYTSGTTSKPKGVVTTHANVEAQVTTLVQAWEWTSNDHILHALPLHHVHGIINALACALWVGATCEMLPRFDAAQVWKRIQSGDATLLMGVPTMYARLIRVWESTAPEEQVVLSRGATKMRLMVSGSAALPVSTLKKWRHVSGHVLLERYGMTEIGMALSNPLHGERVPGHVGKPLLGVELRLVDENGETVLSGTPGEIEVRGPSVFREYWQRPDATKAAFRDGWFRTGDVAVVNAGNVRILGRQSVDVIKTGGYKVSALEIEEVLREHPSIAECAVVGVDDEEWGECVCALVVLQSETGLTPEDLRDWAKERLAKYKVPQALLTVERLPRNTMGKVQKQLVRAEFAQRAARTS